uniref:Uncharacterized protein n=1 Tax=Anguilla anguilla TaxID=7936 RepID=A0A0E9S0Q9_ANGAN
MESWIKSSKPILFLHRQIFLAVNHIYIPNHPGCIRNEHIV